MEYSKLSASFHNNPKNFSALYDGAEITLIISPGQPYHENEKFKSTIELINRSKFKKCFIMIGDSNYRHTLKIYDNLSDDEAYNIAAATGNAWLDRNLPYIKMLTCEYEIIRWNSLVSHPNYLAHRKAVDDIFSSNLQVRDSFMYSAEHFISRSPKAPLINKSRGMDLCLEYLLEECAIIMPMWSAMGHNIYVYPQKMLRAMEATYTTLVEPHREIRWLSLRFSKKYAPSKENLVATT